MMSLGPLAFTAPWILAGLAALPVIYWLLRVTPPAPRLVSFPAVRLLLGLSETEQTPARTPLWLLLLRLGLAALLILALAGPVWNRTPGTAGAGPLVLVVDNGWAAAARWEARAAALDGLLAAAERDGRPVVLAPTARQTGERTLSLMPPGEARAAAARLTPEPWGTERGAVVDALAAMNLTAPEIVWIADGVQDGDAETATRLAALGAVRVLTTGPGAETLALVPPAPGGERLTLRVLRPEGGPALTLSARASGPEGRFLGGAGITLPEGATTADAVFDLPTELRNEVARVGLEGVASAGAVVLLDESARRRPVGLVSGAAAERAQPLLSDLHYLARALEPFAELREGSIETLVQGGLSVLILSDVGQIVGDDRTRVAEWVEKGGTLVRFAGPRLATQADDLIPVQLRSGGRALGGALSWERPQGLGPYPDNSPFQGLPLPRDVLVTRQVLAEPGVDLSDKIWARLADGTPLVTAERRGQGTIVLVHVTANADWSSLPLSGLYVEMLRRLVALAHGVGPRPGAEGTAGDLQLAPRQTLDGFGRLLPPPATALPAPATKLAAGPPGPGMPPGFYGPEGTSLALNVLTTGATLQPLGPLPAGVEAATLGGDRTVDLAPPMLGLALALVMFDFVIGLLLRGFGSRLARRAPAGLVGLAVLGLLAGAGADPAMADDSFALQAANQTRLAYVITGDPLVDDMSRAGLAGLTQALNDRTAVEAGEPIGVDVETDEIAFFPLLYWPMTEDRASLSPAALAKIDHFMKHGGTILFDTRDADLAPLGTEGPGGAALRSLLAGLDIPPLVPVPEGHVLTKAFYLLSDFPGRFDGGQVWVEAPEGGLGADMDPNAATASSSDGVSSIIIGANDWAAAWARDAAGRPVAAVTPGGERQRELATRFGINLVMYALTGNYKSDQVHVPALLERLGQ